MKTLLRKLRVWDEASNRLHAVVSKKGDGIIPLAAKYIEKYGGPPTYQTITLPSKYELEEVDLEELKNLKECVTLTKEVVGRCWRCGMRKLFGVSSGAPAICLLQLEFPGRIVRGALYVFRYWFCSL